MNIEFRNRFLKLSAEAERKIRKKITNSKELKNADTVEVALSYEPHGWEPYTCSIKTDGDETFKLQGGANPLDAVEKTLRHS